MQLKGKEKVCYRETFLERPQPQARISREDNSGEHTETVSEIQPMEVFDRDQRKRTQKNDDIIDQDIS